MTALNFRPNETQAQLDTNKKAAVVKIEETSY